MLKKHTKKNFSTDEGVCGLKCSVTSHSSLNTSKDIVQCPDLSKWTEEQTKEGMVEQGVTDVRRIAVPHDSIMKPTNTFVLTFNTVVKIGFIQVKVDVYIPNPLWCYNCQVFGHIENKCGRHAATVVNLNIVDYVYLACVKKQPNGSTAHVITMQTPKICPQWEKEKKILKIKYNMISRCS